MAQMSASPGAERERMAGQRAAVEARFAEREAACRSRFAVTDCVNEAKKERSEALAPMRRQVHALDDAERRQRAARRQDDVRSKEGSAQARERELVPGEAPAVARKPASAASAAPAEPAAKPVREAKQPPPPRRVTARASPRLQSPAERQAQEAAGQARIAARKEAAQAHREAVEQRNAERAVSGKRAAPLPVPASAALP